MGSQKVLENFSWGPGKSWKSRGFFSSERVGTLGPVSFSNLQLEIVQVDALFKNQNSDIQMCVCVCVWMRV